MKITLTELKQIIREEVIRDKKRKLNENSFKKAVAGIAAAAAAAVAFTPNLGVSDRIPLSGDEARKVITHLAKETVKDVQGSGGFDNPDDVKDKVKKALESEINKIIEDNPDIEFGDIFKDSLGSLEQSIMYHTLASAAETFNEKDGNKPTLDKNEIQQLAKEFKINDVIYFSKKDGEFDFKPLVMDKTDFEAPPILMYSISESYRRKKRFV
jgi:hypothetical protein